MRVPLFVAMLCSLSAGCAVGPDFQPPQPDMPQAFVGAAEARAPSVPTHAVPVPVAWWKLFNDPVLDSLITRAALSNLDLKTADTRIREARANKVIARAELLPRLGSLAEYNRSSGPTLGSGRASGTRGFYQVLFDFSWELDLFGGLRRGLEAAEADLNAAVAARQAAQVSVLAEVARNYVELRGFQRELAVANENLAVQRKSVALSRERFEAGFVSFLDVANAEAQVASTESQIPLLEAAAAQSIYSLGVLLGELPQALLSELSPAAAIPGVPPEVPVGLPSELLKRRPDIREAESALHAAVARVGEASAELFPRFALTASAGGLSDQLKSIVDPGNRLWSVIPNVTWPLFDAGVVRANIEIRDAQAERALIAYQQTVLTALQEVESALAAYTREQQHRAAVARAVAANRKAVELATSLYAQGHTDFLNVISAKQQLFQTEDALAQSDRNVSVDLIALYKALGGGW